LLFGLIAVLELALIRYRAIGKRGWRRLQYLSWLFAAIGIITLSADVRGWVARSNLSSAQARAITSFALLRDIVHSQQTYVCRSFVRPDLSPINFDHIVEEYEVACNWYRRTETALSNDFGAESLPRLSLAALPSVSDLALAESLSDVEARLADYEAARLRVEVIRAKSQRSGPEESIYLMSGVAPLLRTVTT